MRLALGLLLGVASCVQSDVVRCGDKVCPAGTVCAAVTAPDQDLCVQPVQLEQCRGKGANDPCEVDGAAEDETPDGRCYDGVCLTAGCGNGRVDPQAGEVCDDGNAIVGDGCSGSCFSDESCGNGIVDPIVEGPGDEQCDDGNRRSHDGCDRICLAESPRWTKVSVDVPRPLYDHGMAFIASTSSTLMFGGYSDVNRNVPTDETWEWNGVGWRLHEPVFAPAPRGMHSLAYDPVRDRTVMFGGRRDHLSATPFIDTWEWDGEAWQQFNGAHPFGRFAAAFAWDPGRRQLVLFGGDSGNDFTVGLLDDTWVFDGTSWTEVTHSLTGRPPAMSNHAMAYDPVRGVIVLVGTAAAKLVVWELDSMGWTEVPAVAGPSLRTNVALAFDSRMREVVLAGGTTPSTDSTIHAETWSWNGMRWLDRGVTSYARAHAPAVSDPVSRTIISFGGLTTDTEIDRSVIAWDGSTWTAATVFLPSGRADHAAALDLRRGRTVMFGGTNASAVDETLELVRDSSWLDRTSSTVFGRADGAMAYDPIHDRSVMFGGVRNVGPGSLYPAETWLWDGSTWTAGASGPSGRAESAMAADPVRGRVVLYGGRQFASHLEDTWEWDGTAWAAKTPVTSPPRRAGHVLGYDPLRRNVVLFGGYDEGGVPLSDTWTWDGAQWRDVTTLLGPVARYAAMMAWNPARGRLTLFAGVGNVALADLWEWDGISWTMVPVAGSPARRSNGVMVPAVDGMGVVVHGGYLPTGVTSELWSFQWASSTRDESCNGLLDLDGDTLRGCADPDCGFVCAPNCPAGVSCTLGSRCGDGVHDPLETCHSCPADVPACSATCGDFVCDAGETCPGDCP